MRRNNAGSNNYFSQKIRDTIQNDQMLHAGDRVIVGLSGGADSVSLLSFLWEAREELEIELMACHVNHNLRGAESDKDEAFVRRFCLERKIPLELVSIDAAGGAKKAGLSVELYARQERYRIFQSLADKLQISAAPRSTKIATAHTLSDKAETVLFHLVRGTGLKGLEGIPAVRGNIIRPLISCSREEVEAYCREKNLAYVIDSSNLTDAYTRNRIRHAVVPELVKMNPAFLESIRRLSQTVERDRSYLDKLAEEAQERLTLPGGKLFVPAFLELDPALSERIAANFLREAGAEVSVKKIKELAELAGSGGKLELVKGKRACCEKGMLWLEREKTPQAYFQFPLQIAENQQIQGKKVNILLYDYEKYKNIEKNQPDILKKVLDYDRIEDSAVIRQKKDGDRILLYNKTNTRPLKKMFQEAQIPVEERSRLLLISDKLGPIWVQGFGCSKRVAVSAATKRVLRIELEAETQPKGEGKD